MLEHVRARQQLAEHVAVLVAALLAAELGGRRRRAAALPQPRLRLRGVVQRRLALVAAQREPLGKRVLGDRVGLDRPRILQGGYHFPRIVTNLRLHCMHYGTTLYALYNYSVCTI